MKCGALSLTSDTRTISGMLRFLFDSRMVQETYRGAEGKGEGKRLEKYRKKWLQKMVVEEQSVVNSVIL